MCVGVRETESTGAWALGIIFNFALSDGALTPGIGRPVVVGFKQYPCIIYFLDCIRFNSAGQIVVPICIITLAWLNHQRRQEVASNHRRWSLSI